MTVKGLATVGMTALCATLLPSAPTFAGGVGVIGSPAFDNTCVTLRDLTQATGRTAQGSGFVANVVQLPVDAPYQSCGGADFYTHLPMAFGQFVNQDVTILPS